MSPEVASAIWAVREAALKLKVRTKEDSLALTVGNTLPLMAEARGMDGVKLACTQILNNLRKPESPDKRRLRHAAERLLQLVTN